MASEVDLEGIVGQGLGARHRDVGSGVKRLRAGSVTDEGRLGLA